MPSTPAPRARRGSAAPRPPDVQASGRTADGAERSTHACLALVGDRISSIVVTSTVGVGQIGGRVSATSPNVVWSEVDNEVIVLDTSSGDFYSLNATASEVWKGLESDDTLDTIAARLSANYGIDVARAAEDVSALAE